MKNASIVMFLSVAAGFSGGLCAGVLEDRVIAGTVESKSKTLIVQEIQLVDETGRVRLILAPTYIQFRNERNVPENFIGSKFIKLSNPINDGTELTLRHDGLTVGAIGNNLIELGLHGEPFLNLSKRGNGESLELGFHPNDKGAAFVILGEKAGKPRMLLKHNTLTFYTDEGQGWSIP